jgi:uncharacterized damage-inducible protein DinB
MPLLHALIANLDRMYHGPAWHGPALREALQDLSASDASARPVAGTHSIHDLVYHVSGWIDAVRQRFEGAVKDEPDDGDFPAPGTVIDDTGWAAMLSRMDDRHRALVATLERFDESRLDDPAPRSPSASRDRPSYFVTLIGLAEHNAYHTGQIQLLRRSLGR